MTRNIFLLLLAIIFQTNMCCADILSTNTGEQAMIKSLRLAINEDSFLKSQEIIIGAGISGCEAFTITAKPRQTNILLVWQWLDEMKNLAEGTVVVLPEHAIDKNFNSIRQKIKLITINGVLHTRTMNNITKENSKLIKQNTDMIVMLAGDTQQADGTWVLYTEKMAKELIEKLPSNINIIFLNGPRTGKHKMVNGIAIASETAHRVTIDEVTQFLIDTSATKKSWQVIDFKFGQDSLWGPALKFCLERPETIMVLPGESTSMISEALTLGIRPVIYKHKAMTKTSKRYVDELVKSKKVVVFPTLTEEGHRMQEPLETQEKKIIKDLSYIIKKTLN